MEEVRQEKIYMALSDTVLGNTLDECLSAVRNMFIKSTRRIGQYSSMKMRPISVEFMYKTDTDYILRNRKYLNSKVFVNKEYCKEIEDSRRKLRPYLTVARKLPRYLHKCKLENDVLVLRGVNYTTDDLHRLPTELSGFNISSRNENNVFGYFGSMNPLSNFHPAPFL